MEEKGSRIEDRGSRIEDIDFKKIFSVFRPGGASEISRWRNHRMQLEFAPWKGVGPKLGSVALSGLEEFGRLSSGGFSTG